MENTEKYWKESFDRTASEFGEDFRIAQWTKHGLDRRLSVFQKIFSNLGLVDENKIILDAGGGPGNYSVLMADNGFKVLSVDNSEKMLQHTRKKLSYKPNVSSRIHLCVADVNYLPIKNESVDLIICFGVFQHISSELKALREFIRVLKFNSCCVINAPNIRFFLKRSNPRFKCYDPTQFGNLCMDVGFSDFQLLPLVLLPLLLRPFESIEQVKILQTRLWSIAQDFVVVARKVI